MSVLLSRRLGSACLSLLLVCVALVVMGEPASAAPGPNDEFHLTYRAASGNLISTYYAPGIGWRTEAVPVGETVASDTSPAQAIYKGNLHYVYRSSSGALVNTWWSPTDGWRSLNVPVGPPVAGDVSAVGYGDAFHIVYRDTTGRLINTRYTTANGWEPQVVPIGTPIAADASPDVSVYGYELHITYRDVNGHVINTWHHPTTGWGSLPVPIGATAAGNVSSAALGGAFHVVYRAAAGHLVDTVYTQANGWQTGPVPVGLNIAANASPDVAAYGDELHVTYRAAQGELVNTTWVPTTGWQTGSVPVGQTIASNPSAVTYNWHTTLPPAPSDFVFPLQTTKSVIQSSSPDRWCFASQSNCHHDYNAADIMAPTGTQVVSPVAGTVIRATNDSTGPGSRVQIRDGGGNIWYMAHMHHSPGLQVVVGQAVAPGTPIGFVGMSVHANGTQPHLHIDRLPPSYSARPSCSSASCAQHPFMNVQPDLIDAYQSIPA